jgi:hypothetical protein
MNTLSLRLAAVAVTVLIGGPTATVQAGSVSVTHPSPNASVGRSLTVTGSSGPETGLEVQIDGQRYLNPADRIQTSAREYANVAVSDGTGRFTFTLDFNGPSVVQDANGQRHGLVPGNHQFVVHETMAPNAGRSAAVSFTLVDPQPPVASHPDSQHTGATQLSASSPAASPSAGPKPRIGAQSKTTRTAPGVWIMLAAGLLGIGAVTAAHRLTTNRSDGPTK